MRQVELIFSYKKGAIGSALIKWHQGAPYSHTAIKFWSNYMNLELVYEANISGVRILPYQTWLEEGNVATASKVYEIDDDVMRNKLQGAFRKLERPYGKLTILAIFFKTRRWGIDGGSHWICSELAYDFLETELPKIHKQKDKITPMDLWNLAYQGG